MNSDFYLSFDEFFWHPDEIFTVKRTLHGGFFLACEGFGRMFDHSFPACAFLFFFFFFPFFFFELQNSSRTLISLFYARISPQWLSEPRRLWPTVP